MNLWLGLLAATVASIGMKASMIALGDRVRIPAIVDRATTFTAPALMAALAARALAGTTTTPGAGAPVIVGAVVGVAVAAWTRSIPWTVGSGVAVAVAGTWLAGA